MLTTIQLFNLMAIVTFVLQVAIVIRMRKRSLTREYRAFFAYTIFTMCLGVFETFCLDYFGFRSKTYFTIYWFGFAVHISLMFFIIQEVYADVLFRYEGLRALSRMIFRWAFMLLVLLAIATVATSPAADNSAMYSSILKLDYGIRIVEFGLIVLLFVFAKALELGWRNCAFGIAVGTCFYCSTQLAVIALRNQLRNEIASFVAFLMPIFSIIALGIWTAYMYRVEDRVADPNVGVNQQLEEWNRAVLQFLDR